MIFRILILIDITSNGEIIMDLNKVWLSQIGLMRILVLILLNIKIIDHEIGIQVLYLGV